jgi:hypothetical protein
MHSHSDVQASTGAPVPLKAVSTRARKPHVLHLVVAVLHRVVAVLHRVVAVLHRVVAV